MTVAVLTFQRPDRLAETLAIIPQRIRELPPRYAVTLLVVDNDPAGSAREVVSATPYEHTRYALEPTPGIAAARNRALEESTSSRLLVFIDDDEIPEERWLTSLVDTWQQTGASAVMGRVISVLPDPVDPWVLAGGYFHRPSRETGTVLASAATGNLLLDLDVVRATHVRFDEALGLGGGEDTVFSTTLIRRGGTIVWCQESVTLDPIDPERATRSWLRQRTFSHGNTFIRTQLRLAGGRGARLRIRALGSVGGPMRMGAGAITFLGGMLSRDRARRGRGERAIVRGLGVLTASVGYNHAEYRRAPRWKRRRAEPA